jgi:hypothetical protein
MTAGYFTSYIISLLGACPNAVNAKWGWFVALWLWVYLSHFASPILQNIWGGHPSRMSNMFVAIICCERWPFGKQTVGSSNSILHSKLFVYWRVLSQVAFICLRCSSGFAGESGPLAWKLAEPNPEVSCQKMSMDQNAYPPVNKHSYWK